MSKLCPDCNYLGKGKHSIISGNVYIGVAEITVGVFSIIGAGVEGTINLKALVGIVIILLGTKQILDFYRGGKTCPKCGYKEMLPLDSPEAINLIKKYDLTPGDNPPPTPQKEPNPDLSNPTKS